MTQILAGRALQPAERRIEAGRHVAGDQSSVDVEIGAEAATASSASRKGGGSSLPRRAARRRIPAQALALKKYRRGRSPVSKMSDNEHTPSSLGDSPGSSACSDVLSVTHHPCEAIGPGCAADDAAVLPAAFGDVDGASGKIPKESGEVASGVARENAGDILP
jgi:hypothetical protein